MTIGNYEGTLEDLIDARTDQLREAISNLERSNDATVDALGNALFLKDPGAQSHSKHVTVFSMCIAQAMGQPVHEIGTIGRAAFLHDIGNLAIPDVILQKPSTLTSDEVETIRTHCLHGYKLLKRIPFLVEVAGMVYAHHEKFDGTGYPLGLRGEAIPLGARIISVADAFDAITSDRPYRVARSLSVAREEIKHCSGSQFDPSVVETFLRVPDKNWIDLRDEIDSAKSST